MHRLFIQLIDEQREHGHLRFLNDQTQTRKHSSFKCLCSIARSVKVKTKTNMLCPCSFSSFTTLDICERKLQAFLKVLTSHKRAVKYTKSIEQCKKDYTLYSQYQMHLISNKIRITEKGDSDCIFV